MEFSELEEFLENKFIDQNLKCKKRINEETDEEFYEKYIRLYDITRLKLNDEEADFVFKYLEKKGINVHGEYRYYSGIYENYIQVGGTTYCSKRQNNASDNLEKLKKYQVTKDIRLRNEIVEANMNLVKYLAAKYSIFFKLDNSILESYGYEGLIESINKFDLSKGSSHMSSYIKAYICEGAISEILGVNGRSFIVGLKNRNIDFNTFEYFHILNIIEKEEGESVKDNPNIFDLVLKRLKEIGYGNQSDLKQLEIRTLSHNPYSIEQLGEDLVYVDDELLYNDSIEKLFQEQLSEFLNNFIDKLDTNKKYTIENYIMTDKSLEKVGKSIGITRQAVNQRKYKALKKLKQQFISYKNKEIVNSFLENNNHEYSDTNHMAYIKKRDNN